MENEDKFISDMTIGVNEVNEQKTYYGLEALKLSIHKLIIMRKGTIYSEPNMGVDISKFRYAEKEDLEPLMKEIEDQISKYIVIGGNINITYSKDISSKILKINIEIDGKILPFVYDGYKLESLNI